MMRKRSRSLAGDKWQWDVVSWSVLGLVGALVLIVWMMVWPHDEERQMREHLKNHVEQP